MKTFQRPLAEVFGFKVDDRSAKARRYRSHRLCPFNNKVPNCTKDKAKNPFGVCSILQNDKPVITCPVRFREEWIITTMRQSGRLLLTDRLNGLPGAYSLSNLPGRVFLKSCQESMGRSGRKLSIPYSETVPLTVAFLPEDRVYSNMVKTEKASARGGIPKRLPSVFQESTKLQDVSIFGWKMV